MLPFLVVHGALVWKLLWVVLVAGTFAIGFAIRRRRARLRAFDRREVLLGEVRSPQVGPSVVRGRVTAGTAATTYRRDAHSDAPATLVLDCDGAIVELAANVHVEEGRAVKSWPWPTVVRSVAIGDEVFATGVLSAEHDDASYRETNVRWQLAGDPIINVVAASPRIRAFPLGAGALVGALLVIGLGWYGGLRVVGKLALDRAEDSRGTARDGVLPAFGAAEIAAAMPGSRDRAIDALDRQLVGIHIATSERALALELELADLRGECPMRILASQARFEDALAAARRCGSQTEVAFLLAILGNYDEAERALAPDDRSDGATAIHIATGNWSAAALGAEARAVEVSHERPSEYRSLHLIDDAVAGQHCLAALFRTYGGDARAFDAIDHTSAPCALFAAAALPLAEQNAAFARIPRTKMDADAAMSAGLDLVTDELAYATGAPRSDYYTGDATSAAMFLFDHSRIWLAPFQLEAHPNADLATANVIAYDMLRGDQTAARAGLAKLATPYVRDELAVALALRDGSPITDKRAARAGFEEAVALRNGIVDERIQPYMTRSERDFVPMLTRAAAGDGRGLVEFLSLEFLQWQAFAIPILGILPRITEHRDEVIAALRMFRNELGSYAYTRVPFNVLGDMIAYRDIARLAGDTADASHWQAIIDRHLTMLRDRRKLTAMLFWRE